ncbi:MAG: Fur family transcriptional regulator [Campylobacterota bacterium]|nr:Fur family transcriptional regulator [Campylobacterota bacterium]
MKKNIEILDKLKQIIKQKGLKYTKQREVIFETILNCEKHLDAEEIYNIILKNHPSEKIGIATIYRALSFLEDANLISSISVGNDAKKFETSFKEHHDHLICVKCNKIVEFVNNTIEKEQEKIAKENGFKLLNHTMYLYGICSDCNV